ncbi:MAG TPA: efflux RND transporter periplasmic adaptor subunit [Steroidobacteraceae bacterium]
MRPHAKMGAAIGALLVVAIIGFAVLRYRETAKLSQSAPGKETPAYWYDPMHPEKHFDKPGKSPFMDMQLLPKYPDSGAPVSGGIEVDSRTVQNLGLRFAQVEKGSFALVVEAFGIVGVDEHRIEAIQVRQPGWVEQLDVRAVGDAVRRGERLAGIYSPDLLATQQEFLIARQSNDPKLIEAARQRLAFFGLSAGQIARIEKSGHAERTIDYFAPFDGYVMALSARQGAAIEPGATLFQLADLKTVWISAEVPEAQAAWIKPGNSIEVGVPALPNEHFSAKVDYLYPELDQATRTLKVRIVVKNPGGHLRPGMFAKAQLRGVTREDVLTVPSEAIIKTGTRSVVIVADDATHFRPELVGVGLENAGRSEILQGLSLGQKIVSSGQFLIDSEANLRGAFDDLAGAGAAPDKVRQLMPQPAVPEGSH